MTPAYRITQAGRDITANFNGRLVDLAVTDEAGFRADALTLVVEDTGSTLAIPRKGAQLSVAIGYAGALRDMGLFVVDESTASGPPDQLTIRAAGASFLVSDAGRALQSQKTRSWTPTTLGVMVQTIAQEQGLAPEISTAAAATQLPHVDQTNESDINLLTRLANERDLVVKPMFGRLVVVSRAEATTTKGNAIPVVTIAKSEVSTWSFRVSNRSRFQSVVATWHNQATGQPVAVTAGAGEPVYRVPTPYPNSATATAAANSYLRNFRRTGTEFTLAMPGRTDMMAEGRVRLRGFRTEFNEGDWKLTRVEHRISKQGFSTVVTGTASREELPQAEQE